MAEDKEPKANAATPAKPKPEELGRPVPGSGEAIEPEALRNPADGAMAAGDRMWGPPGQPKK